MITNESKGIPLEWYEFERIIVDEIHESLCTTRDEMEMEDLRKKEANSEQMFMEKNRRAGRELLGITHANVATRPLRFRRAVFGLTGTPSLDSNNRVVACME